MHIFGIGDTTPQANNLQNRIKAKYILWDFINNDLWPEIENWHSTPEELILQISKATARILHPHFTAEEMPDEVANVIHTLKTKKQKNFLNLVTDDTVSRIMKKMK